MKNSAEEYENILQIAAASVCNNVSEDKITSKYLSQGSSANPVEVIRATDSSSLIVKDFGLIQMLGCAFLIDGHCSFLNFILKALKILQKFYRNF